MLVIPDGVTLRQLERALVAVAMNRTGGVRHEAARQLGITREALGSRLRAHNIVLRGCVWTPECA